MLGSYASVLIGKGVPLPAPAKFTNAITGLEVQVSDDGRTGFQMNLAMGRSPVVGALDYDFLLSPLTAPFNRVILTVLVGGLPQVLVDGIVTDRQVNASSQAGQSTLTLTGEDLTVKMDLEERVVEHPAQNEMLIVLKILGQYAALGVAPFVVPPPSLDFPNPLERIPVQRGTDLSYLRTMASRFGYVFYLDPGPVPGINKAYWGPPIRGGVPQPAITVGNDAHANCSSVNIQYNGLGPIKVNGQVKDRQLDVDLPVVAFAPLRFPLAALPSWLVQGGDVKTQIIDTSGLTYAQAFARAQGMVDAAADNVTVTGQIDVARYGGVLRARGVVGLRGVGYMHDGLYYVKSVSHSLEPGGYTQSFTLEREGVGSTTPVVVP